MPSASPGPGAPTSRKNSTKLIKNKVYSYMNPAGCRRFKQRLTTDHLVGAHFADQRLVYEQLVHVASLEVDPERGQGAGVEHEQQQVQVVPLLVAQLLLVQQLLKAQENDMKTLQQRPIATSPSSCMTGSAFSVINGHARFPLNLIV